ncbi:hypothetical protein ACEPPN_002337 [Leptodophora sp. 'Broadleaf-Isolate-01']
MFGVAPVTKSMLVESRRRPKISSSDSHANPPRTSETEAGSRSNLADTRAGEDISLADTGIDPNKIERGIGRVPNIGTRTSPLGLNILISDRKLEVWRILSYEAYPGMAQSYMNSVVMSASLLAEIDIAPDAQESQRISGYLPYTKDVGDASRDEPGMLVVSKEPCAMSGLTATQISSRRRLPWPYHAELRLLVAYFMVGGVEGTSTGPSFVNEGGDSALLLLARSIFGILPGAIPLIAITRVAVKSVVQNGKSLLPIHFMLAIAIALSLFALGDVELDPR